MTYQPTPGMPPQAPINYDTPAKVSGMALTSMILGILSIVLFIIGPILGIIALILGGIALGQISRDPNRIAGKGYAITGMVTGGIGIVFIVPALLIAILLPSLGRARELANRSQCQANIAGVLKACVVYSQENGDVFPTAGTNTGTTYSLAWGADTGQSNSDNALLGPAVGGSTNGNVLASPWILVIRGQVSPKSFICKSDPAAGSSAAAPTQTAAGNWYASFQNDKQLSYSIAYPWLSGGSTVTAPYSIGGWWRNNTDSSIPLMADMTPVNGTGSPARALTADSPNNKVLNSGNHGGDGENVGFGDAHAEWCRKPHVGQNNDSIYTAGATVYSGWGTNQNPGSITLTSNPYDILMVPMRDLGTGAVR